jgi:hypothetical protein
VFFADCEDSRFSISRYKKSQAIPGAYAYSAKIWEFRILTTAIAERQIYRNIGGKSSTIKSRRWQKGRPKVQLKTSMI